MMNSNSTGRPEPREPRAEARGPGTVPRAPEARAPEPRALEPRAPETRIPEVRAPEAAPRASVLGATLRFRGELSAQEDLIVQGSVDGSITHTQSLTIGTEGSMKGNIRARIIVIEGSVDGDLHATESVTIRSSANVKGNVFAPRVAITEGAFFQGQIEMLPRAVAQDKGGPPRQVESAEPLEGAVVDKLLSSGT